MAPEAGGAQTQHVQKGYHGERLGATACYQRLGFFYVMIALRIVSTCGEMRCQGERELQFYLL